MSTIDITFTVKGSTLDLGWLLKQLKDPNSIYRVDLLEKYAADLQNAIEKRLYHPEIKRPTTIKLQPKITP